MSLNLTPATTTVEVTIKGDTRTIEIRYYRNTLGQVAGGASHTTDGSVVVTIGRGVARYPSNLHLERVEPGHRNAITAADGTTWVRSTTGYARGRYADIVGWADTTGATNTQNQARVA